MIILTHEENQRIAHACAIYEGLRVKAREMIGNDPLREDRVASALAQLYFTISQEDLVS